MRVEEVRMRWRLVHLARETFPLPARLLSEGAP